MSTALSVLLLEDDPSSLRLFNRKMQTAPVEILVKDVRNKETFLRALEAPHYDCIVIDYTLPDIDGIEALKLVKEMSPGTPTIIYTGSVGEEKAVECMKEGASEFLLKTNSIRLVPAILSVVNQRRDHDARILAEEAQKQSEARFRALAETSSALIFIYKGDRFTYVNQTSIKVTGYSEEELLKLKFWELVHPDFRKLVHDRGLARQRGEDVPTRYEFKINTKDGQERWLDYAASAIQYEGDPAGIGVAFDVTDRKIAEEQLKASEHRYRLLFDVNPNPTWLYDVDTLEFLEVNDAAVRHYGYSRKEFLSMSILEIRPKGEVAALEKYLKKRAKKSGLDDAGIWKHIKKNGDIIDMKITTHTLEFEGHNAVMVFANEVAKPVKPKKKKK
jgi:PAS domain S-box-containing protein